MAETPGVGLEEAIANIIKQFVSPPATEPGMDLDKIAYNGRKAHWLETGRELKPDFHPSQLADPCLRFDVIRKIILDKGSFLGISAEGSGDGILEETAEEFDWEITRSFDTGDAIHWMEENRYFVPSGQVLGFWRCSNCHKLVDVISAKPVPCLNEITVREAGRHPYVRSCQEHGRWGYVEPDVSYPLLGIRGRVDLILGVPRALETWTVVDLKTTNAKRFEELVEPDPKNVLQLQIYLLCLGIPRGILRYLSQGDPKARPKHFQVERNPTVETWVASYIKSVNELAGAERWKAATMACSKPTLARARRCPFNKICFEEAS